MSRLTRDGTAEPVSCDQILRHVRGQGNFHFTSSADHQQDWQPYPVDPYSAIIIIIIIISAHKSDLSYPWSQTQASLSIPSLHQKNTNKRREREEKNNRRENLPRSDRRGREKIKQEQKNKSKDPPRISERQIDKQARQTKCQDHTNCRYRTRVAKHTPPVAGRGAADSQALRQGAPV